MAFALLAFVVVLAAGDSQALSLALVGAVSALTAAAITAGMAARTQNKLRKDAKKIAEEEEERERRLAFLEEFKVHKSVFDDTIARQDAVITRQDAVIDRLRSKVDILEKDCRDCASDRDRANLQVNLLTARIAKLEEDLRGK